MVRAQDLPVPSVLKTSSGWVRAGVSDTWSPGRASKLVNTFSDRRKAALPSDASCSVSAWAVWDAPAHPGLGVQQAAGLMHPPRLQGRHDHTERGGFSP